MESSLSNVPNKIIKRQKSLSQALKKNLQRRKNIKNQKKSDMVESIGDIV